MPASKPAPNIWHNGKLIPWEQATLHVMSHVVHYGSSVFEGIRCYGQPQGSGVFRLPGAHAAADLTRPRSTAWICLSHLKNSARAWSRSSRPMASRPATSVPTALRGYGEMGVSPKGTPVEVYIANFPWGKYIGSHGGADVCISSWNRLAPNTMPALAKAGANYMNSQLIRMEAEANGYEEGIGLDVNGLVSEGSGENIFVVRNGVLYTPPLANSALSGITRDSVLTIARHLGMQVTEQALPRELLYIADEVFFTGTAAEVSPIRSIDRIVVGDGKPGEITKKIAEEFFGIANGLKPDRFGWLTPVNVKAAEPVTA